MFLHKITILNTVINPFFSLGMESALWIIYPFLTVIMTMSYIYLKLKNDAMGLEFKMLKMIAGQQFDIKNELEFVSSNLVIKKETSKNQKDLHIAGILSRFTAYFIDVIIAIVTFFVGVLGFMYFSILIDSYIPLIIYESFPYAVRDKSILLLFAGLLVFFTILFSTIIEIIMKGSSPGKKIVGIIVVNNMGERPSNLRLFFRNVFRILDFLPIFYILGLITLLTRDKFKRIGDYFAGTVVVRISEKVDEKIVSWSGVYGSNLPPIKNIYPINEFEFSVIKEFMDYEELFVSRKAFFAYNLNVYFRIKFKIEDKYTNPYDFFRDIISMNEKQFEGENS